jgi:hypothetical protein
MTPKAAKLLNLANGLPPALRLEVAAAITEADNQAELGDSSAWRWLPEQIAYLARRHPEAMYRLRRIYRALLEMESQQC